MREQLDKNEGSKAKRIFAVISNAITDPLGYLAALALFITLLITLINVIQREVTGRGIDGTIEYTEVVLVVATFAALAIAQKNGTHIATSFVTSALPRRFALILNRFVGLLGAIIVALIVLATYDAFMHSMERGEYTMGIARVELWPGRLAVFVGFAVYLYEYLRVIARGPSMRSVSEEAQLEFKAEEKRVSDD